MSSWANLIRLILKKRVLICLTLFLGFIYFLRISAISSSNDMSHPQPSQFASNKIACPEPEPCPKALPCPTLTLCPETSQAEIPASLTKPQKPYPKKSYIINMPQAVEAKKHTLNELERSRFDFPPVEIIPSSRVSMAGVDPQIGLSLAMQKIWQKMVDENIEAAFVFEDDIILHDDFATLFPLYWARVPDQWELVNFGGCPGMHDYGSDIAQYYRSRPCTHMMAYSLAGAKRLLDLFRFGMALVESKVEVGVWVKADFFTGIVFNKVLSASERAKGIWTWFESTRQHPPKVRGIKFPPSETLADHCPMEDLTAFPPIKGAGLAFQHGCRGRPDLFEQWFEDHKKQHPNLHYVR